MPGTGRGRYEPLSRLNLVERLLLLELLLLLLLLLLLVKTPLVQSIPPCPSEGRVEIAIGRRRLPLDAAGHDASHARAGVVAGLGERVEETFMLIILLYLKDRTHVARCHDPLVDASELRCEVHVQPDWGSNADWEGGARAGV